VYRTRQCYATTGKKYSFLSFSILSLVFPVTVYNEPKRYVSHLILASDEKLVSIRADHLTRSSTADHNIHQLLAEEVLRYRPNHDYRNITIRFINRLSSYIGYRGDSLRSIWRTFVPGAVEIDNVLCARILSAVSFSNVAQFIVQLKYGCSDCSPRPSRLRPSKYSRREQLGESAHA
jgi:hypothetical protein